jgi:hypothetical protein
MMDLLYPHIATRHGDGDFHVIDWSVSTAAPWLTLCGTTLMVSSATFRASLPAPACDTCAARYVARIQQPQLR